MFSLAVPDAVRSEDWADDAAQSSSPVNIYCSAQAIGTANRSDGWVDSFVDTSDQEAAHRGDGVVYFAPRGIER